MLQFAGEPVEESAGAGTLPPLVLERTAPLERERRLSESFVWRLQRSFYERQGIDAWRSGDPIPFYVTTSPYLVRAYVRLVEAFWRSIRPEANAPLYVMELGTGHARFGFRFLRAMQLACAASDSDFAQSHWKYVMTDLSEANLDFCRSHPWLRPWVDAGRLDFARFELGRDESIELLESGEVLSAGHSSGPLVAIANYLLDSVPQDAFHLEKGQLFEQRVTVTARGPEPDLEDPAILSRVQLAYSQQPVTTDYYSDPTWNQILEGYRQQLPDSSFVMPTMALAGLQALERIAAGQLLMLAADKAYTRPDQFPRGGEPPAMVLHGNQCFSMSVNFDAVGRYCALRGGEALHPRRDQQSLTVSAFMLGVDDACAARVRHTFVESIGEFGPDDFYTLMGALQGRWETLSPDQIFAYLRLAHGDDWILSACLPVLMEQVAVMTESQRQELRLLIREVCENYLPIGDAADRAFELGILLYQLACYPDALQLFQQSLAVHGPQPGTLYNIGACYSALRQPELAVAALRESLQLDPAFDPARELLLKADRELQLTRPGGGDVS